MTDIVRAAEDVLARVEKNHELFTEEVNAMLRALNVEVEEFNSALDQRAQELGVDVRVFGAVMVHVHRVDRKGGGDGPEAVSSSTP